MPIYTFYDPATKSVRARDTVTNQDVPITSMAPDVQRLVELSSAGDQSARQMLDTHLNSINASQMQQAGTYTPDMGPTYRTLYGNLAKGAADIQFSQNALRARERQLQQQWAAAGLGTPPPLPSSAAPVVQAAPSPYAGPAGEVLLPDEATYMQDPANVGAHLSLATTAAYIRAKQRDQELDEYQRQMESRLAGAQMLDKFAAIRKERERLGAFYGADKARISANPGMDKSWTQITNPRTGMAESIPDSLRGTWNRLDQLDEEEFDLLMRYNPEAGLNQRREQLRAIKDNLPDHVRASWGLDGEPQNGVPAPPRFAAGGVFAPEETYAPGSAAQVPQQSYPAVGTAPTGAPQQASPFNPYATGEAKQTQDTDIAVSQALEEIAREKQRREQQFAVERQMLELEAYKVGLSSPRSTPVPAPPQPTYLTGHGTRTVNAPINRNAAVPV